MQAELETLMLALAIGSTVVVGAKRVGVPYNVALVVVGLLAVLADVLPHRPLDPELVLLVFLPMLVFEAALFSDLEQFRRAARPILALGLPGVFISVLVTGGVAAVALKVPFAVALLLGALLAITDTVSVLLAFHSVRVPARLAAIMEGESLFNDGTALVLVSILATVCVSGHFAFADLARGLSVALLGGALIGVALGALGAVVIRRAPDHRTALLTSIVLVFATSLAAERVHASPVIAVVVLGLLLGTVAKKILEPSRVLALNGFWETSGFVINVLLFLFVGMELQTKELLAEAPSIALALVALHVGRAIAVYASLGSLRFLLREKTAFALQHVMVVGNIKGALSMAAVLMLPLDLPYRDRLVTIVFGVTFVTLVTQGLSFAHVLRWLGVTLPPSIRPIDEAKAALISAKRGQSALDELLASGLVSQSEHAARRAGLERVVTDAEKVLAAHADEAAHDHLVDTAVLLAQKAAIQDAGRRGLLLPSVADAEVDELDKSLDALAAPEESPS